MPALAYYNENDPYAAQWLRNLIQAGHIAYGVVDERDIRDVRPDDLREFTQCHFFAGIGGWSYALRLAGWPDDRPVWTGSCPCQPFSAAGKGGGFDDERHLWPHWHHLIACARPTCVFGEQVASKDGLTWLDLVSSDMEAAGYAFGALDICAAGVGAPHIRQRLWFVGQSIGDDVGRHRRSSPRAKAQGEGCGQINGIGGVVSRSTSVAGGVADAQCGTAERWRHDLGTPTRGIEGEARQRERLRSDVGASREPCSVGDADGGDASAERLQRSGQQRQQPQDGGAGELAAAGHKQPRRPARPVETEGGRPFGDVAGCSAWSDLEWLPCTDGKARPVEPGLFPLVDGLSFRVGSDSAFAGKSRAKMLRGAGNAIVPEVAAEFIAAYLEFETAAASGLAA